MKRFLSKSWRPALGALCCLSALAWLWLAEPLFVCRLMLSGRSFAYRFVAAFRKIAFKEPASVLMSPYLPWGSFPSADFGGLWGDCLRFLRLFATGPAWLLFLSSALSALTWIYQLAMAAVALALLFRILGSGVYAESGLSWRSQTRASARYERLCYVLLPRFGRFLGSLWGWFRDSAFFPFCVVVALFGCNVPAYAMDLVSVYFEALVAFDFGGLLDCLLCLGVSAAYSLSWIPLWIDALVAFFVFRLLSMRRADAKLRGFLRTDRSVVSSDTGVFLLCLGKMRAGKTTVAQSVARMKEVIFRDSCLDNMDRIRSYFPAFPWIALEHWIAGKSLKGRNRIRNIEQAAACCEGFARSMRKSEGYDFASMPVRFYDGSVDLSIGDAMAIYAESYFVYFYPSSLIAGNIPVRSDNIRLDKGHLVLWDSDWVGHDNRRMWDYSYLSHDLDFDALRFGRKVDPSSPFVDASGPSVVLMTEFGKEYGNQNTNSTVRADDEESNSKNDMMDVVIKLGGHLANVWHDNLFGIVADEQYSGSLAAQLTNVAQSVFTLERRNIREGCALSLFWAEPIVLDWILGWTSSFLRRYSFEREDRTLLWSFVASIDHLCLMIEAAVVNRWGYKKISIPESSSDSQGNFEESGSTRFFVLNKVDYADRFESACMKDFLNQRKLGAKAGFFDLPEYGGLMPSPGEWLFQRSHLVEQLRDPESAARFRRRKGADGRASEGPGRAEEAPGAGGKEGK